jgi:membrane-associated phospholipid phosphatase
MAQWRDTRYALYVGAELAIPFMPVWIWAYASMAPVVVAPPLFLGVARLKRLGWQCTAALLFSCACFLAFPSELGFVREVPDAQPYRQVFEWLFASDRANNLVPSLHVSVSALCLAAFALATPYAPARAVLWAWLAFIMASTVLVHQHHLLDVASGVAVAWLVARLLPLPKSDA